MNNRKKQRNRRIILIITVAIIVFSSISLIFSRTQWGIERTIPLEATTTISLLTPAILPKSIVISLVQLLASRAITVAVFTLYSVGK